MQDLSETAENTDAKEKGFFQKFKTKRTLIVIVLCVLAAGGYYHFNYIAPHYQPAPLSENQFADMVQKNEIESVVSEGKKVTVRTNEGKTLTFLLGDNDTLRNILLERGVDQETLRTLRIEHKKSATDKLIQNLLIGAFFVGLLWFIIMVYTAYMLFRGRKHLKAGNMSDRIKEMFGVRTKAIKYAPSLEKIENVTFDDIGGQNEAIEEVKIVVDFLKNPHKYTKRGAKLRNGILMTGPSGVGKTWLAKAIAQEAGVPFFYLSGSDFAEMFVGVGPARVRDTFEQARAHAPCIVFFDELDSVGRQRSNGMGSGANEKDDTLNQLLVEIDGFKSSSSNVVVIGATNRPDLLDGALTRNGRFGTQVRMVAPDINGREAILKIHAGRNEVPFADGVHLRDIASITTGLTGADLESVINEAAMQIAYQGRDSITTTDLKRAVTKIFIGTEMKSVLLSDEEKMLVAYHEAGHALCSTDPVQRISIIPSTFSLGHTLSVPEREEYTVSKKKLIDTLCYMYGGRAAEMVAYGEGKLDENITSGAKSDIPKATELIRQMVEEWGLSEKIGPVGYKTQGTSNPLIPLMSPQHSEETKREIDLEVKRFAEDVLQKAVNHLTKNKHILERFAQELYKKETLEKEEIADIMKELK
ncbi:MAG: AAA family ATPase [bacterium]|nr:AAA family ATPase [bacterium]